MLLVLACVDHAVIWVRLKTKIRKIINFLNVFQPNIDFGFCEELPDDTDLQQKERGLMKLEDDIMAQFNGSAKFDIENPDFNQIDDPLKKWFRFARIKILVV